MGVQNISNDLKKKIILYNSRLETIQFLFLYKSCMIGDQITRKNTKTGQQKFFAALVAYSFSSFVTTKSSGNLRIQSLFEPVAFYHHCNTLL